MGSHTLGQATVIAMLGLLLALPAVADTEAADRAFSVGNDAFRSGNYTRALAKYEEARAAGKDGGRLVYNLGLTHFRLGQYAEARSAFLESIDGQAPRPIGMADILRVIEETLPSVNSKDLARFERFAETGD